MAGIIFLWVSCKLPFDFFFFVVCGFLTTELSENRGGEKESVKSCLGEQEAEEKYSVTAYEH